MSVRESNRVTALIVSSEIVFAVGRAALSGGTRKIDFLRERQSDERVKSLTKPETRLAADALREFCFLGMLMMCRF